MTWWHEAACLGQDPEDWYPVKGNDLYTQARATCATCPVIQECLTYALRIEAGLGLQSRSGMWAGLTPQERAALDPVRRPRGAA